MRIVFFLIFIIAGLALKSQEEKPPTQEEMQAELRQTMIETKQQIDELKKQIAEAKANKENPDNIIEMEKQLSILNQMMQMLDKTSSLSKSRPETVVKTKPVIPKYKSLLIPIPLKQPVTTPTKAQAKDQLLWYRGRRIDANTLVTTEGMVVWYDRANNRVVIQPAKKIDTPYVTVMQALAKTEKNKYDFAMEMDKMKNSFFMYPEIVKAYEEFDIYLKRYENIMLNTIDVPGGILNQTPGSPTMIHPLDTDPLFDIQFDKLKASMRILESLLEQLKNGDWQITSPPKRPNDLCICDPGQRVDYEAKLESWIDKFWDEEEDVLRYYKGLQQYLEDKRVRRIAGATSPDVNEVLAKAFRLFLEVRIRKINELRKIYAQGNVYIEEALVLATIDFQKMMVDFNVIDMETEGLKVYAHDEIQAVKDLVLKSNIFENFIEQQKSQRNYNVVLDYSFHISHHHHKELLDAAYQTPYSSTWYDGLKKFNQFTATFNINFEYHQVDKNNNDQLMLAATGTMESKPIMFTLGRGEDCKWKLIPNDPDYRNRNDKEDSFHVALKVKNGERTIYKATGEVESKFDYTGPDSIRMFIPLIRVGFCNQSPDSIILEALNYSSRDLNRHRNDRIETKYTVDMLFYANKMFLSSLEIKDNINDVLNNLTGAMNLYSGGIFAQSAHPYLESLLYEYTGHLRKDELQLERSKTSNAQKKVIKFFVDNGARIFNIPPHSTVNPNDEDNKVGLMMKTGVVIITIEHTPQ